MARSLPSPYVMENVDEAFAAFKLMPHCKVEGYKMPTKAQFRKTHAVKHPIAVAKLGKSKTTNTADPLAAYKAAGITDPAVLAIISAFQGLKTEHLKTEQAEDQEYPTPLTTEEIREQYPNAARNAVLWRLNVEGFLVLDPSGGNAPIEQGESTAHLTAKFGPIT